MHVGPKYKIAKRLGAGVFEKTQSQKFVLSEARSAMNKKRRFGSKSEFAKQLLEKQKVRVTYYISERQFKNYVMAATDKGGVSPSENLFIALETRLDNALYRLGLAPTRQAARQMAAHGHIRVNDKRATVPSLHLSPGDVISVRSGSRTSPLFLGLVEKLAERKSLPWITFDAQKLEGKVVSLPKYDRAEHHFDLAPVLEFYSR